MCDDVGIIMYADDTVIYTHGKSATEVAKKLPKAMQKVAKKLTKAMQKVAKKLPKATQKGCSLVTKLMPHLKPRKNCNHVFHQQAHTEGLPQCLSYWANY